MIAAGVPGLEPRTTVPETAVLPITPYPNGLFAKRARQTVNLAYFTPGIQNEDAQNVSVTGSAPGASNASM